MLRLITSLLMVLTLGACGNFGPADNSVADADVSKSILDSFKFKAQAARAMLVAGEINGSGLDTFPSSKSNILILNEDGQLQPINTQGEDLIVSFAIMGPKAEFVYFALDFVQAERKALVRSTSCAFFRLELATDKLNCAVANVLLYPNSPWMQFRNNSRHAPLQFDDEGRLYFIGTRFNVSCERHDINGQCSLRRLHYLDSEGKSQSSTFDRALFRYDPRADKMALLLKRVNGSGGFLVASGGSVVAQTLDVDRRLSLELHTAKGNARLEIASNSISDWVKTSNNQFVLNNDRLLDFNPPDRPFQMIELPPLSSSMATAHGQLLQSDDGRLLSIERLFTTPEQSVRVRQLLPARIEALAILANAKSNLDDQLIVRGDWLFYIKSISHPNFGVMDGLAILNTRTQQESVFFIPEQQALLNGDVYYNIHSLAAFGEQILMTASEVREDSGTVILHFDLAAFQAHQTEQLTSIVRSDFLSAAQVASMQFLNRPMPAPDSAPAVAFQADGWNADSLALHFNQAMDFTRLQSEISVQNDTDGLPLSYIPLVFGNNVYLFFSDDTAGLPQALASEKQFRISLDPAMQSQTGLSFADTGVETITKQWQLYDKHQWLQVPADLFNLRKQDAAADQAAFMMLDGPALNADYFYSNVLHNQLNLANDIQIDLAFQSSEAVSWSIALSDASKIGRQHCKSVTIDDAQLRYDLGEGALCETQALTHDLFSLDDQVLRLSLPNRWLHLRIKFVNQGMALWFSVDGETYHPLVQTEQQFIAPQLNWAEYYRLELSMRALQSDALSWFKINHFLISRLDAQGELLDQPGDLVNENFNESLVLSYDNAEGNGLGLDDTERLRVNGRLGQAAP